MHLNILYNTNIYMRKRATYKGIYRPSNPKKYADPNRIVYRSNWERKFMCIVTVTRILYIGQVKN